MTTTQMSVPSRVYPAGIAMVEFDAAACRLITAAAATGLDVAYQHGPGLVLDFHPEARAAISFAPSLVAGIYGMNFDQIPELHWPVGYPFALALMVVAALALHRAFKWRGWL